MTRVTIWVALLCYFISAGIIAGRKGTLAARILWTLGCAAYLAHVLCAFQFFHGWSHAAAYEATARQTGDLTGWRWGGGVFINYFFTLVWIGDAAWWWVDERSYASRAASITRTLHGFFMFMIFNGAVVFGQGPVRWFGLAGMVAVAVCYALGLRRREVPL